MLHTRFHVQIFRVGLTPWLQSSAPNSLKELCWRTLRAVLLQAASWAWGRVPHAFRLAFAHFMNDFAVIQWCFFFGSQRFHCWNRIARAWETWSSGRTGPPVRPRIEKTCLGAAAHAICDARCFPLLRSALFLWFALLLSLTLYLSLFLFSSALVLFFAWLLFLPLCCALLFLSSWWFQGSFPFRARLFPGENCWTSRVRVTWPPKVSCKKQLGAPIFVSGVLTHKIADFGFQPEKKSSHKRIYNTFLEMSLEDEKFQVNFSRFYRGTPPVKKISTFIRLWWRLAKPISSQWSVLIFIKGTLFFLTGTPVFTTFFLQQDPCKSNRSFK